MLSLINIMKFDAAVIQVRGPIHHFLHNKTPVQIRNMAVVVHLFDVFELLILPFD